MARNYFGQSLLHITTYILQLESIRGDTPGLNTIKFEHMIKDFFFRSMLKEDGTTYEQAYTDKSESIFALPPLFSKYTMRSNTAFCGNYIFIPLFEIKDQTGNTLKTDFLKKGIMNLVSLVSGSAGRSSYFTFSETLKTEAVKSLVFNGEPIHNVGIKETVTAAYFLLQNTYLDSVILYIGCLLGPFKGSGIDSDFYKGLYCPYIIYREPSKDIRPFYFNLKLDLSYISKGILFNILETDTNKQLEFTLKPVTEAQKNLTNFDYELLLILIGRKDAGNNLFFEIRRRVTDKSLDGLYLEIHPKNDCSLNYLKKCQGGIGEETNNKENSSNPRKRKHSSQ
ncbi:hypothetical protein CDIK_2553 [Cucumispora dikerogammari]|nr:hypothetical protein CDIK_2553 [Cucumispora dikerogammari]